MAAAVIIQPRMSVRPVMHQDCLKLDVRVGPRRIHRRRSDDGRKNRRIIVALPGVVSALIAARCEQKAEATEYRGVASWLTCSLSLAATTTLKSP